MKVKTDGNIVMLVRNKRRGLILRKVKSNLGSCKGCFLFEQFKAEIVHCESLISMCSLSGIIFKKVYEDKKG